MSSVTDTILTFGVLEEEDDALDGVNRALRNIGIGPQPGFVLTSAQRTAHGGGSALQTNIALAAFNHVPDSYLVAAVRSYAWEDPDAVRLLVNREHDERGFSELEWRP